VSGKPALFLLFCFSLFRIDAIAQTTVTTTGGTANTIPLFSGSATLGSSVITQSGGNIGIGTTTPGSTLDVNGSATIRTSGSSETWSLQPGHNGYGPSLRSFNSSSYAQGQIESSYLILNGETGGYVGIGETIPRTLLHVTVPGSNSLQWAQVLQNPGSNGVGVGLQFKASVYADGNATENNKWSGIAGVSDVGSSYDDYFGLSFYTHNGIAVTPSEVMRISSSGKVGIGTATPGASLEVNGSVKLTSGSGASMTYPDGTVQSTAWNGTTFGGDYAESVDVAADKSGYEPGDIIVIDRHAHGKFLKSDRPYLKMVAGIYSTKPGLVGRRLGSDPTAETTEIPMALIGIVPTKVSAENGPIEDGDLLVTSSTPGVAMKGTDPARMMGAVVGKALNSLDSGTGIIEVLIRVQ
jgi:hypothetical protein